MKSDIKRYAMRTVRSVNKCCRRSVPRERYQKLCRSFSRSASELNNMSGYYFAGRNRVCWLSQFFCEYGLDQDSVCTQEHTPRSSGEIFKHPNL